jgi:putative restriction endonuclease
MTKGEFFEILGKVKVWSKGSERAPHKPLLLLLALAKCSRGESRLIPFSEINTQLTSLLKEFGPTRSSWHPEYPFWRLQTDNIWEVPYLSDLITRKGHKDPKKSELLAKNVAGGFSPSAFKFLRENPKTIQEAARMLLEKSFPETIHDDILQAIGIQFDETASIKKERDPEFRNMILRIYEQKCAICGFDVRLRNIQIGLEAAHIQWHQAGGPGIEANGVALCSLHHKLFDRGAFCIDSDFRVLVSEEVTGSVGLNEWLLVYHRKPIRKPLAVSYLPGEKFLCWHVKEVFHGPPRE